MSCWTSDSFSQHPFHTHTQIPLHARGPRAIMGPLSCSFQVGMSMPLHSHSHQSSRSSMDCLTKGHDHIWGPLTVSPVTGITGPSLTGTLGTMTACSLHELCIWGAVPGIPTYISGSKLQGLSITAQMSPWPSHPRMFICGGAVRSRGQVRDSLV